MMRARGFAALASAVLLASLGSVAGAQGGTGVLAGRVVGGDSVPVRAAIVRATLGPRTLSASTNADGDYRIPGLEPGMWILSVRSVGYQPVTSTVQITSAGARGDFTLVRTARALDPVLVAANWSGIRGTIVDARTNRPLEGARVELTGARGARLESDAAGRFAAERIPGSEVVMRVKRDGFGTRVVVADVPRPGYVEVEIALDTVHAKPNRVVEGDLDSRLRWRTPFAGIIPREELERSDSESLVAFLRESPTMVGKGLVANRKSCVFVNGVAKPGFPIDAIPLKDIEFVEVYPAGTERSGTLASRWPRGATCGAPSPIREWGDGLPGHARYVSVWTRDR